MIELKGERKKGFQFTPTPLIVLIPLFIFLSFLLLASISTFATEEKRFNSSSLHITPNKGIKIKVPDVKPNGETTKEIIINKKIFIVPQRVYTSKFGFLTFTAPLSFRINAEDFSFADRVSESKDFQWQKKYISVQLLNTPGAEAAHNAQSSYQKFAKKRTPKYCAEFRFGTHNYQLCHYEPIKPDRQSTQLLINKNTGDVLSYIKCWDVAAPIPNPNCLAKAVIFDDIWLSYLYNAKYTERTAEISIVVHEIVRRLHANSREK